MKYIICLAILCLMLAVPLLSHAQDKPLCEQYICVTHWNFNFNFGSSGSSGGTVTPVITINGDNLTINGATINSH
jgi:hypothetical protein